MTQSERDQRLAAKLRENLRRRKAQAKARVAVQTQPDDDRTDDGAKTADTHPDTAAGAPNRD